MPKNKKAVEALASSGGDPKNNKLFVHHINTPHRIGQSFFQKLTGVFMENRSKQSQCFHCQNWFDWLPFGAVSQKDVLRGVYVGICKSCIDSLLILPPSLQQKFWLKVERKLKNSLEVNAE